MYALGDGRGISGDEMRHFKKLLVMLMIMTLTLGLIGCGKSNSSNNSSNSEVQSSENNQETTETPEATTEAEVTEEPEATQEAVETTEVTYPVDITDSNGDVVTIESAPETIVSVAPNMTELVFALGDGDKLIGRTDYCDYPEEAASIPTIGTLYTPDIEAIVALEPDVVLVSTHFDEENEKKLTDLGVNIVCLYEENDIYGVYTMIETLGTILNRVEEANVLVQDMKDTFDSVAAAIEGQEQPTVYYVVGYGDGGDYTATGDTFINGLITLAGGDNIAKDATSWTYSLESLLEADPDVIIIGTGMAADFSATENYSELTAVKEGRVYEMDTNLFDRQGYRNAEGVKELAQILYPDLVK